MLVCSIEEWQSIQPEQRSLQATEHHECLLVTCLNVPAKLLQHVECVRLEQADSCTSGALEDNRPLARRVVALHAVDKRADVGVLLFHRQLACVNQRVSQFAHYVSTDKTGEVFADYVAADLGAFLNCCFHALFPHWHSVTRTPSQVVQHLMVQLTHIFDGANVTITLEQRSLVRTEEVANALCDKLRGRRCTERLARHLNASQLSQFTSKRRITFNQPLDGLHFSAQHDWRADDVDQAVCHVQAQHSGSQDHVGFLCHIPHHVSWHSLVGNEVLRHAVVLTTKPVRLHDLVGCFVVDQACLRIAPCFLDCITRLEAELVDEVVE